MKRFIAGVAMLVVTLAQAADAPPFWAYPVNPPAAARESTPPPDAVKQVPGSPLRFTQQQVTDINGHPPDWFPGEHPTMPGIVGRSRAPNVSACGYCHLPDGAGRPENASLAGLSAGYIKAQIAAFRDGRRTGAEPRRSPETFMITLAKGLTDAEIEESAAYFAAIPPQSHLKVIESTKVPRAEVTGWVFHPASAGGEEPLGNRILEFVPDFERFENRDSHTPYVVYVPKGSIRRGAKLVEQGAGGRTLVCATCHGVGLHGKDDVPRIAGRSPSYLFRQLYDLRGGLRSGPTSDLMKPVVANLNDDDLLAIVAYLASRSP